MIRMLNRVFTRILLLAVVALGSLAAVGGYVIWQGRANLYDQKKNDVRHVVEVAMSIITDLDKRAMAGEMTREQAQAQAIKTLRAVRYGNNDYVFIYDLQGTLVLNPLK